MFAPFNIIWSEVSRRHLNLGRTISILSLVHFVNYYKILVYPSLLVELRTDKKGTLLRSKSLCPSTALPMKDN